MFILLVQEFCNYMAAISETCLCKFDKFKNVIWFHFKVFQAHLFFRSIEIKSINFILLYQRASYLNICSWGNYLPL